MSHIVCIWEMGADLGHLARLSVAAKEFVRRGHQVTLAAKDLSRIEFFFRGSPVRLVQAPVWLPRLKKPHLTKTIADILAYKGYGDVDSLKALVRAWRTLLEDLRPDALVYDFAPTAMFAARALCIPQIIFSNGFSAPASEGPAMDICPWVKVPPGAIARREQHIVHNINKVAQSLDLPEVSYVGNLFNATKTFITDLPMFDPYARQRHDAIYTGPSSLHPDLSEFDWGHHHGPKVFLYLKPGCSHVETTLKALVDSSANVRGYFPGEISRDRQYSHSGRFLLANKPLNLNYALNSADAIVIHGGVGTLCSSLLHGLPVFALPTQIEQKYNSLRLEENALGAWVDRRCAELEVRDKLSDFLASTKYSKNARLFANEHSYYRQLDVGQLLVGGVEQLLKA